MRSERQLVERLDTDLLFRWFCGLDPAEEVFDATAFTHNRPRLDAHGVTGAFFSAVRARGIDAGLASNDHFSIDGTLVESSASRCAPERQAARRAPRPGIAARKRMRARMRRCGCRLSQRARKKVEEAFGWTKTIAGLARARHVGRWKIRQFLEVAAAAFNLVRMRNLMAS